MKKKLSLELDQLAVESFDTSTLLPPHGTVRGHDDTSENSWRQDLCDCPTANTCEADHTCGADESVCVCSNGCTGYSDCRYIHSCGWSVCQYSCWGTCGDVATCSIC